MSLQLDNVIEVLLSPDNQRRQEAQNFINNIPNVHFEQGIDAFLLAMNHEKLQVACMAALLLKKKYMENQQYAQQLTAEKLGYIVNNVKGMMSSERPILFLKRCCDILVKAYNQVKQEKELINVILELSSQEAHNMKLALYYLIEISCECSYDDNLLMEYSNPLISIFQKGMADTSNQVKVGAFKTLTIFLSSIQDEKHVKKFSEALNIIINMAIQLIKFDQESGVTAVQSINELIEAHPKFIKPVIPQMLNIFTEIMEAQGLLINLRTTSMFGILNICINHASSVRKLDYFKTHMVPAYMKILAEIHGTSMEEWNEELNDEIISKNDISLSTEEHLGHLTDELTNKFMLPLFIPHIQNYLSSPNVEHQHAGLVAMAILTQNCHQSFKTELKNIMSLIVPLLNTDNSRLMHDMLLAIGYMSEEFSPQIQKHYGEGILEFIIKCLQFPSLKVQYKAVQCITNFEKGLAEHKQITVIEKYLQTIMQQLSRIFEFSITKTNYILMDTVLDTLTTLADMNPFDNYYQIFMPFLKKLIASMPEDDQQQIMARSKAVETMGYLLASVKHNVSIFQPDCEEIMQAMLKMTLSLNIDDPLHKSIFVVYENVVTSLKENFLPYCEHIFPSIIQAASRNIELTIIDEGDKTKADSLKGKKHNYAAMKVDMKVDGVKSLVLNTDHLAQKIEATNLLVQMAEDMGSAFAQFIERTIEIVKMLISYKHNKEIRNNMIETVKYLIKDCANNDQKAFVVAQTFDSITQQLAINIRNKDNAGAAAIVETLAEMMPSMNQQMGAKLPSMLVAVLNMVRSQTKQVEKEYAEKQMDEALEEEMNNEIEEIEQSLEYVQNIIKAANGMPQFEELRKLFPPEYQFD